MGKTKTGTMKKQRVIVIILVMSLVIIAGISGWWYVTHNQTNTKQSERQVTDMNQVANVVADGRRFVANKDIKGGEARFDSALQSAQADEVKLQLLLAKVNFYIDANEIDRAIATAQDADKQFPNMVAVYVALASAYERKGDKAAAVTEYRRALAVLGDDTTDTSKPAPSRSNPRAYYESRIKELEQ